MIELADVAGPRVLEEDLHRAAFEAGQPLAIALRVLPQEVLGEQRRVFAPVAQRRQADFDGVEAEEQILPESPGRDLFGDIGVGGRNDPTSTRRVRDDPRRSNSPVSITRSSLFCWLSGTFAISSRNSALIGELEAADAIRLCIGKSARTWPKSSLSNTPSDTPPELTTTIGLDARLDTEWRARATTPLPVPFSPSTRTLASDGPTREITCSTFCIAGDSATILGNPSPGAGVLRFEPLTLAERLAQFDLRPDDGEEARVVPGLLDDRARPGASPRRQSRRCPRPS